MSVRVWLTVVVGFLGLVALILSIRWIATTDGAPWTTSGRHYGDVDQRWFGPIGIGVDTIYIAAGVANGADGAYWVGMAALAAVQTAMLALILVAVHHRNARRRTSQ
jgi:hypothetical protein